MRVNVNILKSVISRKRLIVERNGWKCSTHLLNDHIYMIDFMSDCLSPAWGHSAHFQNCCTKIFSKCYFSADFNQIFYEGIRYHREILTITFLFNRLKLKNMPIPNVNMGVNWKILKSEITRIWLVVERNGCNFGTSSCRDCIENPNVQIDFLKLLLPQFSCDWNQTSWQTW